MFGEISKARLTHSRASALWQQDFTRKPSNTTWPRVIEKHASRRGKYFSLFVHFPPANQTMWLCLSIWCLTWEVSVRDQVSGGKRRRFASLWQAGPRRQLCRLICPVILAFVAFSSRCLSFLTTHLSPVKPTEAQKLLTAAPPHLWCCYGFQRFLYDYFGHFILI